MSGLDAALDAALARAAEVTASAADATRSAPVDPAVRAALDEVSGPSAPAAERAVGDLVRRGDLGWDDLWRDPASLGPAGTRLVQRAIVVLAHRMAREAP